VELSPGERITVVSPHLDDAVLSVGATIAQAVRHGVSVTVLTVLACDPESTAPTQGWDARAGFATEGQAARARRAEDAAACAVLGAAPRWLAFGAVDYERHGTAADVTDAVGEALADADVALLPGAPLTHPDHDWLVQSLLGSGLGGPRLGIYAEQPYRARLDDPAAVEPPAWLADAIGCPPHPERGSAGWRDWLAKRRALRCYRSQLPLLALAGGAARLERHLWSELHSGGERVWTAAGAAPGRP
jgi:LmbE family N-acetylglucosaminyl deacetylase